MKRLMTDEVTREVLELARDGVPYSAIADQFGISRSVVNNTATRHGIRRYRMRPAQVADAAQAAAAREARAAAWAAAAVSSPVAAPEDVAALFAGVLVEEPDDWRARALCAQTDPEVFYPEKGGSTREAKAICRACPVQQGCLEYALDSEERFGIWGGKSERERRKIRKDRPTPGATRPCPEPGCDAMFTTVQRVAQHVRFQHPAVAS